MKKRNRGGRKKSKTAPLRRRIRRLLGQLGVADAQLSSLNTMLNVVREAQERTGYVAHGRSLFVLSIEDMEDFMEVGTKLRLTVERAHWDGRSLVWDGIDTQLCCELLVDRREVAAHPDAVAYRVRERGAMIGARLAEQLWARGKALPRSSRWRRL